MTICVNCGEDTGSDFPEIDTCFECSFGFGIVGLAEQFFKICIQEKSEHPIHKDCKHWESLDQKERDHWIHAMDKFLIPIIKDIRADNDLQELVDELKERCIGLRFSGKNLLVCYEKICKYKNKHIDDRGYNNLPEVKQMKESLEITKDLDHKNTTNEK